MHGSANDALTPFFVPGKGEVCGPLTFSPAASTTPATMPTIMPMLVLPLLLLPLEDVCKGGVGPSDTARTQNMPRHAAVEAWWTFQRGSMAVVSLLVAEVVCMGVAPMEWVTGMEKGYWKGSAHKEHHIAGVSVEL